MGIGGASNDIPRRSSRPFIARKGKDSPGHSQRQGRGGKIARMVGQVMLTISMCMSNEDSVDSTQAMLRKPFYSSSLEALADIYNNGSNNAKKGFSK